MACNEETEYCGEKLKCRWDRCSGAHSCYSMRFGHIGWDSETRPVPQIIIMLRTPGVLYGSREADSNMLAASLMQDAVNRMEYILSKKDIK